MSAEAGTIATVRHLRQRAMSLGAANGFEYGVQFLIPIVLVRCLDTAEFGQYRLLWLVVATVGAFANMAMTTSLFYFLPRVDQSMRRVYVNQTFLYMAVAGSVAAVVVSDLNPFLPGTMDALRSHGLFVPAFIGLWILSSMLDELPAVEERTAWQAKSMIGLASIRALALCVVAAITRDVGAVFMTLLVVAGLKLGVFVTYVIRYHGIGGPLVDGRRLVDQLKYAVPFGAGGALYMLRVQADQWVAATLFPVALFAAFSIAAVLGPMLHVVRRAVSAAFMPSISRLQAGGDIRSAIELNTRANIMVGTLVYPVVCFTFVFAEELITLVYTAAYVDAAPVMRVYLVGLVALVVELTTMTLVLRQGPFMLGVNLVGLVIAVTVSWYAARTIGLAGAAMGSVTVIYTDRIITLLRISRLTGVRIRDLQLWPVLLVLLTFAAIGAGAAWALTSSLLEGAASPLRLLVGAAVVAGVYGALYLTFLRERHLLRRQDDA